MSHDRRSADRSAGAGAASPEVEGGTALTPWVGTALIARRAPQVASDLGDVALVPRSRRSTTALVLGSASLVVTSISLAPPLLLACALALLLVALRLVPDREVPRARTTMRSSPVLRSAAATCFVVAISAHASRLCPGVALDASATRVAAVLSKLRDGAVFALVVALILRTTLGSLRPLQRSTRPLA